MGNFPNRFSLSWQLFDKDKSNESGSYLTTNFKNSFKTMVQYLEGSMVTFQANINVMKNIMVALIALLLVTNLVCAIYLCVLNKRQTRLESQSNSTTAIYQLSTEGLWKRSGLSSEQLPWTSSGLTSNISGHSRIPAMGSQHGTGACTEWKLHFG